MAKPTGSLPLRRSTRVNISLPVKISGTLANRMPFTEMTQIVTVSKFGAKLKSKIALNVGMQIKLAPQLNNRFGMFKVVWVGGEGTPRAGEFGIEHPTETAPILGISFPEQIQPVK